jgi:hypothetical protein
MSDALFVGRYDPRQHMLQLNTGSDDYLKFCRATIEMMAAALSMPRHLCYSGPIPTRYSHLKGRAWPKMPRRLRNLRKTQ